MDQESINNQELRKFTSYYDLTDIHTASLVSVITSKNNILEEPMKVIISLASDDSYVSLLENLESSLYPTTFKTRFGKMYFDENKYLEITGTHPTIGQYIVKIIPIKK